MKILYDLLKSISKSQAEREMSCRIQGRTGMKTMGCMSESEIGTATLGQKYIDRYMKKEWGWNILNSYGPVSFRLI